VYTVKEIPLTVSDAAEALRSGTVTSVELTTEMLARADALDSRLGTYVCRFDDYALARAQQADTDFAKGVDKGMYQGIPIAVKDILAMAEGPTTANSLILDSTWGEGKDGPVVSRLKASGAVITGKVTTMEFAIGAADASKPFPIPRNPWDLDTWPGGSSSGTGNGIAAGLFYAGIGTDTGGSIRLPAALCGTSGMMPTFGRVPKSGCVPLGYSLDHIGPLARSARDCAAMLAVIAGYDPSDESCADRPVDDYLGALDGDLHGVRIGVERAHHFPEGADPALVDRFDNAVEVLASLGADIVEVTLPYYEEINAAVMATMASEALAYHRGDLQNRWGDYFEGSRAMFAIGALVSSADYVQAQRVRRAAQRRLRDLFGTVDLVVSPTAAIGAPAIDSLGPDRILELFTKVFTSYWDATGNPALVVPMGSTEGAMPLSLQIAGDAFAESLVLRAGDAYQSRTSWHLDTPPLSMEPALR
jgi:aspartyl-tRNA(Asn)/glutamyl-tRNA(Gln) amidotransferase subunit A